MLANVFPQECHHVIRLAMSGQLDAARAIQLRLVEPDWQILSRGAAGIKAALQLLGFEMGAPRSPVPGCDAKDIAQISVALVSAGCEIGQ